MGGTGKEREAEREGERDRERAHAPRCKLSLFSFHVCCQCVYAENGGGCEADSYK